MRPITLGTLALLAIIYFALFSYSSKGYGYAGYGGYHHGPSFWYFGGANYYPSRSLRQGSLGTSGTRGGGLHAGK